MKLLCSLHFVQSLSGSGFRLHPIPFTPWFVQSILSFHNQTTATSLSTHSCLSNSLSIKHFLHHRFWSEDIVLINNTKKTCFYIFCVMLRFSKVKLLKISIRLSMVRIFVDNITGSLSKSNSWVQLLSCPEAALVLSSVCFHLFYTVWKALVWAGIITGVAPMRVRFPGLSLGEGLCLELEVVMGVCEERRSGVLGTVWM